MNLYVFNVVFKNSLEKINSFSKILRKKDRLEQGESERIFLFSSLVTCRTQHLHGLCSAALNMAVIKKKTKTKKNSLYLITENKSIARMS